MQFYLCNATLLRRISLTLVIHAVLVNYIFIYLQEDSCLEMFHNATNSEGCTVLKYTKEEFLQCLKNREDPTEIYLIGDSHLRFLYDKILNLLFDYNRKGGHHRDNRYQSIEDKLLLDFKWVTTLGTRQKELLKGWVEGRINPSVMVLDCTLHVLRESVPSYTDALHDFRNNLLSITTKSESVKSDVNILWYLQPPVIEAKRNNNQLNITNSGIDAYNDVVQQVLSGSRTMTIWKSTNAIAKDRINSYRDSTHVGDATEMYFVQMLINYLCNRHRSPSRNTTNLCCLNEKPFPNIDGHSLFILIYVSCFSLMVLILSLYSFVVSNWLMRMFTAERIGLTPRWIGIKNRLLHIFHTLFILAYSYLVNRTPLLRKTELSVHWTEICVPLVVFFLFGIFSIEKVDKNITGNVLFSSILNELKGLAISALIVSEWSKDLLNHNHYFIEMSVTGIFLTIFGVELLFMYSSQESFGWLSCLRKISQHLLMAVALCIVLRQSLQFYSVVLLMVITSMNVHVVMWSTCWIRAEKCYITFILWIVRLLFLYGLFMLLFYYRHFIFGHFPIIFATNENTMKEWNSTYEKVSFCAFSGFLMGLIINHRSSIFSQCLKNMEKIFSALVVILFLVSAKHFFLYYNEFSLTKTTGPFFSIYYSFAVISYLILRSNLMKLKWTFFSSFSCLGNFWLEIYLLYKNIALPFEGKSILHLVPFNIYYLNSTIVFFILISFSYQISHGVKNIL